MFFSSLSKILSFNLFNICIICRSSNNFIFPLKFKLNYHHIYKYFAFNKNSQNRAAAAAASHKLKKYWFFFL